ncbi:MAG: ABC transporter permease [Candidatus Bipolaricaulia bacterium]
MLGFIIRRTLVLIPTLLVTTMIIFGMMQLMPGEPIDIFLSPNVTMTEQEKENFREQHGLDDPIYVQYVTWLTDFFQGDMGRSFNYGQPVWDLIKVRIGPTALLAGTSLLLALAVSIVFGTISAVRQYTMLDNVVTGASFFGVSLPDFWFALILIFVFPVSLDVLPTSGMNSVKGGGVLDVLRHMILPVIVLSTAQTAILTRYMRSSVLEVLHEEFVSSARAKGLGEFAVIVKHVMRNSMMTIVTIVGLSLPFFLSGALIVEQVFSWPGLGQFFWRSVGQRDYPVIMALLTMTSFLTLLGNFLADLAYGFLDPRIQYD